MKKNSLSITILLLLIPSLFGAASFVSDDETYPPISSANFLSDDDETSNSSSSYRRTSKRFQPEEESLSDDPEPEELLFSAESQKRQRTDESSSSTSDILRTDKTHAQIVILIDQKNAETPDSKNVAITKSVARVLGLREEFPRIPLLTTNTTVYNFLMRYKYYSNKKSNRSFKGKLNLKTWNIYHIKATQFLLFIPKEYNTAGFALNSADLTPLPNRTSMLITRPELTLPATRFNPNQLKKVFKIRDHTESSDSAYHNEQLPVWDILIQGHGKAGRSMCGLPVSTIQTLLKFFDKNIYTGTVLIQSCGAGGQNSNKLQFETIDGQNKLLNLHFTVILGSISDEKTYTNKLTAVKWKIFFEMTKNKNSLHELITALSIDQKHPSRSSNIPQVWVPGGYGFQTYNVDNHIKILSKALVTAHEDEHRPIVIPKSAEVVLVYPQEIHTPVILKNPSAIFVSMIKTPNKPYHHFSEIRLTDKAAIKPFLHNILRQTNIDIIIDALTCTELPLFRKRLKFGIKAPATQKTESQNSISATERTKRGLPPLPRNIPIQQQSASSSQPVFNVQSQGFSIQELIDFDLMPKPTVQLGKLTLDLSDTDISDLSGLTNIPNITNIEVLNLNNNQIATIPHDIFMGFNKLKELSLAHNQIEALPSHSFHNLIHLKTLYLNNNKIKDLDKNAFWGLKNLRWLRLNGNQMTSFDLQAFVELNKNIKLINLNNNPISKAQAEELQNELQKIYPDTVIMIK
jgi:hypothetical protein